MALPAGRKGVLASELTPDGKIKGGGGSTLYLHRCNVQVASVQNIYDIVSNSSVPFTEETFYEYIGTTSIFHHIVSANNQMFIYVIEGVNSNVKKYEVGALPSTTRIQVFTDTVTTL